MRHLQRSVLLTFPVAGVYDLVGDIDRYAEFLPWCIRSEVLTRTDSEVVACLGVNIRGWRETLVTRNRLIANRAIVLELVEGPFRHFEGRWNFTPLGDDGCRVYLDLSFELASRLMGAFAAPYIDRIADKLVDAFATRARQTLGGLDK